MGEGDLVMMVGLRVVHFRKREREEIEEVREKFKKEKEWKEEWDVSEPFTTICS